MKAIFCGHCGDIRALRSKGPVTCECGNLTGWWVNDRMGIAKVWAKNRDGSLAKIIGFHNGYLAKALAAYDYSSEKWKEFHEETCEGAEGYVFKLRGCPIAIIGIGQSTDVSWADELPEGYSA